MQEGRPLLGSINNNGSPGSPAIVGAAPGGTAGIAGSIVNLTNTILGAGLLSIPFAFRLSGMALGLMFLAVRMPCCVVVPSPDFEQFVWAVSALSFDVLVRAAHVTGLYTYKEIALKAWGRPLALFAELCIFCYTFLNLISRPIILSQYLTTMFASWLPNGPPILRVRKCDDESRVMLIVLIRKDGSSL